MVHATDTDVLVIAIITARLLEGCKIWLAFGRNKNIAAKLGDNWYKGLLFMHTSQVVKQSHLSAAQGRFFGMFGGLYQAK